MTIGDGWRKPASYAQLGVPVATALAGGRPGLPAALIAVAVVTLYLAGQATLVRLGHRGELARHHRGPRAGRSARALGAVGLIAGLVGVVLGGDRVAWAVVAAAAPVVVVGVLGLWRREATTAGQAMTASAIAGGSLPVAIASRFDPADAWLCWFTWSMAFTATICAGRYALARGQGRVARGEAVAVALVGFLTGCLAAAGLDLSLAALPMLAVAVGLVVRPTELTHLRTIGWAVAAATLASGLWMVVVLRG